MKYWSLSRSMIFSSATRRLPAFFDAPIVAAVGMTVAMRRKKSAAMFPEQRPDLLEVGLGGLEIGQIRPRKKFETAFAMRWRDGIQPGRHLEQEQQPMALVFVAALGDDAGEMQIGGGDLHAHLLPCLAAGAFVRGLAILRVQFAAAGTPQSEIRLLRPFHEQDFIALIETIKQRGDLVRQCHAVIKAAKPQVSKPKRVFSEHLPDFSVQSIKSAISAMVDLSVSK